jgi:hypothetical protein
MLWVNFQPQVHWPFSGSVAQDIHPALLAQAGNQDIELRVLRDVASYGKQIGVLSELLHSVASLVPPERLGDEGRHAFAQLTELIESVKAIKGQQPAQSAIPDSLDEARALWRALLERHPQLAQEALPL